MTHQHYLPVARATSPAPFTWASSPGAPQQVQLPRRSTLVGGHGLVGLGVNSASPGGAWYRETVGPKAPRSPELNQGFLSHQGALRPRLREVAARTLVVKVPSFALRGPSSLPRVLQQLGVRPRRAGTVSRGPAGRGRLVPATAKPVQGAGGRFPRCSRPGAEQR